MKERDIALEILNTVKPSNYRDYGPIVRGLNRYGFENEYAIQDIEPTFTNWTMGWTEKTCERTDLGDRFVRAVGHVTGASGNYGRFQRLFHDLMLSYMKTAKYAEGIHKFVINGRQYWFRAYMKYERFANKPTLAIESLDDFGRGSFTTTELK